MMSAQRVTHNPPLINDATWPAARLYLNLPTDSYKRTLACAGEGLDGPDKHAHTYACIDKTKMKVVNLRYDYIGAKYRRDSTTHKCAHKHTQCIMQASMCRVKQDFVDTHKHTPSCVDGWGTRVQFGPDILGQYNTQLLSLITLARTIKPHYAIAHTS